MLSAREGQENLKQKCDETIDGKGREIWYMRIRRKGCKIWKVVRTEACHLSTVSYNTECL
jgi:hypothetical protein